jgi:hypothetical protein
VCEEFSDSLVIVSIPFSPFLLFSPNLNAALLLLVLIVVCASVAAADAPPVVLDRDGSNVVLEAYAPNIIRVTLSLNKRRSPCSARLWFCGNARGR